MSNSSGSFSSPVNIGTLTSTSLSGSIAVTIPAGQATGTGYRIRVTSTNFPDIGDPIQVNLTISNNPVSISSFSLTNGLPGDSVTINGNNFIGTSSVKFNGISAGFRFISNTQIRAAVPLLATTGTINVTTPCATVSSTGNFTINNFNFTLKLFIQGNYLSNGSMTPTLYQIFGGADTMATDTLFFKIHSQVTPYLTLYSGKGVIKKNGICTISIPGTYFNSLFYVEVKTRNSLETWSKVPIQLNAIVPFNLTN